MLDIFTSGRISYLFLCNFLLYLAIFGFFRSYPMYLVNDFYMGVSQLSYFIAWISVPVILYNLFLLRWILRFFSERTACIIFTIILGVSLALIPVFKAEWTL